VLVEVGVAVGVGVGQVSAWQRPEMHSAPH
jgi:hypothetical protein